MARACGAVLVLARVVLPVPLYVVDEGVPAYPSAMVDPEQTQLMADEARNELAGLATQLERDQGVRVETEVVLAESVAHAIMDISAARQADLIAMTTHGRGVSRLIVGSVADKVIRGSELPLLLFHPNAVGVHHATEGAAHAAA
jgi:nucleotide-binding universal stress UspA family protein